ncbi:Mg2+-importing ATPase [Streptacidiphilus sp. MAP12-20]
MLRALETGHRGLDEAQAELRLVTHGENTLPRPVPPSWPRRLLAQLRDPFAATLCMLVLVTALSGAFSSAAVLTVLVVAGCALRLAGELRAERDTESLRSYGEGTATVLRRRDGAQAWPVARELPLDQFVPGDLVRLAPGDPVPADLLLLRAEGLTLDQSALTGVSVPVGKHAAGAGAGQGSAARSPENDRLCLRGSTVAQGTGTGVVLATGADAFLVGSVPATLPTPAAPPAPAAPAAPAFPPKRRTAFDSSARAVSGLLLRLALLSGAAGLLVGAFADGRTWQVVPYAAAVAVGLTPEMLLLVVTAALARQASVLRGRHVYARRLTAVHDLGAVDVLCTDKTGTLTRDSLTVSCGVDPRGGSDPQVLHWAAVNSLICTELGDPPVIDSVDEALLDAAWDADPDFAEQWTGVAAVPFDPSRRIAVAVVRARARLGVQTLVVKGAVEDVLARCRAERGGAAELTDDRRAAIVALAERHAADGLRVLAVALAEEETPAPGVGTRAARRRQQDPYGLELLGLVTLTDEPEESAASALAELAAHGIAVKIVTGDRPGSAERACRDAGFDPGTPLLGPDTEAMDDAQLRRAVESATVFALAAPAQKARIVRALRANGHTVGFLGDGLNDLPALHAADVGLSSPGALDEGPRRSADLVLAAPGLGALGESVRAARTAVANIGNYLRITLASNVGNVVAMLAAGAMVPFLPMLPVQVLTQNLCFDAAQLALAFDRPLVDSPTAQRPRLLDRRTLARFALLFGCVNAVADLATFVVLRAVVGDAHAPHAEELFHSGWFTENLITQAVTVQLLRVLGGAGLRVRASWPVRIANLGLAAVGLLLPATPVGAALGLRVLPISFYALLAVVLAGYAGALMLARGWNRAWEGSSSSLTAAAITGSSTR